MRRGNGPSPRMRSTRNEGFSKEQDGQGQWPTKVVSAVPETERGKSRDFADFVQIHPRTNRGRLHRFLHLGTEHSKMSVLGMAAALLPRRFPTVDLLVEHGG